MAGYALWRRGGLTIVEAVRQAAGGSAVAHYALVAMRGVLLELNLDAWEKHPGRLRSDVRHLFRRAIGRLTPHRGGWVTSRSHRSA